MTLRERVTSDMSWHFIGAATDLPGAIEMAGLWTFTERRLYGSLATTRKAIVIQTDGLWIAYHQGGL